VSAIIHSGRLHQTLRAGRPVWASIPVVEIVTLASRPDLAPLFYEFPPQRGQRSFTTTKPAPSTTQAPRPPIRNSSCWRSPTASRSPDRAACRSPGRAIRRRLCLPTAGIGPSGPPMRSASPAPCRTCVCARDHHSARPPGYGAVGSSPSRHVQQRCASRFPRHAVQMAGVDRSVVRRLRAGSRSRSLGAGDPRCRTRLGGLCRAERLGAPPTRRPAAGLTSQVAAIP
jgi:hypothetical protein